MGSNLGDRIQHLRAGVSALGPSGVRVIQTASVYVTEPKDTSVRLWFLNTAIEAETDLEPAELMRVCLALEESRGRVRDTPNAPRTLDIDIILFEERIIRTSELTIPHPRYAQRRFVLQPLAEIAREQVDPLLKQTVGALLERVEDTASVELFAPAFVRP